MNLENDLILRAARGEKTERTPVWLMRQAGRILPEYRAVRSRAKDFLEFVKNPDMACEVTVQPVDILGVDAAIIFSDILVIPEAMGLPYKMIEAKGPWFEKTIANETDEKNLRVIEEGDLNYVYDAIRLTKKALNNRVPLIGFCGAPWTLFCYMVEGQGSKTFSKAKKLMYTNPVLAKNILQKITDSSIIYLKAQVKAGADLVQVFDSWAGVLGAETYANFSAPYIKQICDALSSMVPVTVFAKDAHFALPLFAEMSCRTVGLDWTMDPIASRKILNTKTLQGNLDPCLLYSDEKQIKSEAEKMLKAFGPNNYIANLGHGLYPDTEKEKVKFFVDCIKNFRHE